MPGIAASGTRPGFHVTAESGWVNDPHGVVWHEGRYHLFFQHVPGRTTWAPECTWGHAVGPDLAHWERRGTALVPEGERGCWTGTVVVAPDGRLDLLYTSVDGPEWDHGRIAVARATDAGLDVFRREPGEPLVDGPPEGSGVTAFRDPFVWRAGDGWRMVVGGGTASGGVVLQYASPDLRTWTCLGVLCHRDAREVEGTSTGRVWECPQLFPLGGSWVLLVGVWDDGVLHHVAAGVGHYDGRTFTARRWTRLTAGDSAYATTSFLDAAGRRSLVHWLRERPGADPGAKPWAGALSVAQTVDLADDDRLVVAPHPDLAVLRGGAVSAAPGPLVPGAGARVDVPGAQVDVEVALEDLAAGTRVGLAVQRGGSDLLHLEVDGDAGLGRLSRPGEEPQDLPVRVTGRAAALRLLLDAEVLEAFAGEGPGAWRIDDVGGTTTVLVGVVSGRVGAATLRAFPVADGVR